MPPFPRSASNLAWYLLLLGLVPLPIISNFKSHPRDTVHEDELYWIGSTYYYHLAFIERDWRSDNWQLLPARENPPLGKFVMGAALHLHGRSIESLDQLGSFYLLFARLQNAWGVGEAHEKRSRVASRVTPEIAQRVLGRDFLPLDPIDLQISRRLMGWLAVATAIGLYVIGIQCQSPLGGFVAGIWFGLHPVATSAYTAAMIDMVALCFSVWFIAALIALASNPLLSNPCTAVTTIAAGVLLALACGSKMNALIVVGVALVTLWFLVLQHWRYRSTSERALPLRKRWTTTLCALVIAAVVFVAANPTLYTDLVGGLIALVREHRLTADLQENFVGPRLRTIEERWTIICGLVMRTPLRTSFMLLAVGWQLLNSYRYRSHTAILVLWWFVALGMLLTWMPFSWSRYALPLVPPAALIFGKTFADVVYALSDRVRAKLISHSP